MSYRQQFSTRPSTAPRRFVLDFETTGLDPLLDQVLNVGLRGADHWDALVSDAQPSSPEALHVHGLDPDLCRCLGQPGREVLGTLLERFGPGPIEVVAHNASFEHRFLEAWAGRHSLPLPDIHWRCTLEQAWGLVANAPFSCRLGQLSELFGWSTEGLHGAGRDASLTEMLLETLDAWSSARETLGEPESVIYLAGPFRGDGTREAMAHDRARMTALSRWAQAVFPKATLIVPHLNFAFADESGKRGDQVREQVLRSCETLVKHCSALIQCGGLVTAGMSRELAVAKTLQIPVIQVPGWPALRIQPDLRVVGVA